MEGNIYQVRRVLWGNPNEKDGHVLGEKEFYFANKENAENFRKNMEENDKLFDKTAWFMTELRVYDHGKVYSDFAYEKSNLIAVNMTFTRDKDSNFVMIKRDYNRSENFCKELAELSFSKMEVYCEDLEETFYVWNRFAEYTETHYNTADVGSERHIRICIGIPESDILAIYTADPSDNERKSSAFYIAETAAKNILLTYFSDIEIYLGPDVEDVDDIDEEEDYEDDEDDDYEDDEDE